MKTAFAKRLGSGLLVCACFCACTATARLLDDFNDNVKTGWTDFSFPVGPYSSITEANGQFQFTLQPVGQPIFSASTYGTETFTLQEGRTLEFRVDLVEGLGDDSFAVVGFFPVSSSVETLSGYGLAKSASDILITKGINKYFYNENVDPPVKNTNVTLVLRMTMENGSVILTGQVLDKDNNDAVLWQRTVVDTPAADIMADGVDDPPAPYSGPGHFVLLCYEDNGASQPLYQVIYDNAQVFVLDNTVLDDFNDGVKTDWQDFQFPIPIPYSSITEANGVFTFELQPVGQPIFSASTKTAPTFDLTEGERLEFRVDLVEGLGDDSFAVLGFFPVTSSVETLSGYGLAKSASDILITKGINKYFYNENVDPPVKNTNVTLVLRMTVQNGSVILTGQVLDKDNNDAVLWERTVVDTPAADIMADGVDDPPAPYLGKGNYVLLCYEDDGTTQPLYKVVYDNAAVSAPPVTANVEPVISEVSPELYANFVLPSAGLSFQVTDDKPLAPEDIAVILNGIRYDVSNGLQVTGSGTNLSVSFNSLSNNVNYVATLQVVDSDGATNSVPWYFDTFAPDSLVIEVEDYNFGGGLFVDDPILVPEGAGPEPDGYRLQQGLIGIDYLDLNSSFESVPYRPLDGVGMQRSLDIVRQKYIDYGGGALGYFDYDVMEIRNGEWMNYTRTFPPGTYEVYLRQAVVNIPRTECVLERVVGDTSRPNQFTEIVGTFVGSLTGFRYRNFPLTDASGTHKITLDLSGTHTFRLRQVSEDTEVGAIYQNYLVFIPTTSEGPLRPIITSLSPPNGAVIETFTPTIRITIQNRETLLDPFEVHLFLDGVEVMPDMVSDFEKAEITYQITPLPPPDVPIQARLVFSDQEGYTQTNDWNFTITYKHLDPRNRRPGPGTQRGFLYRMVQAPAGSNLENDLSRAEDQLALNPAIPVAIETNTIVQVVNFTQDPPGSAALPYFGGDISVPGLYDAEGGSLGNGTDDFAVELMAYLELQPGVYTFGVRTDDGYKITSGSSLRDKTAPPLAGHSGGTADQTFQFIVLEGGLYPFRMVWYERGGNAYAEWYSIDPNTGDKILINDPASPNAIKAYIDAPSPIFVESATEVTGPYTEDTGAVVDAVGQTITIPAQGPQRFFRLRSDTARRITSIQVTGGNVILTYE